MRLPALNLIFSAALALIVPNIVSAQVTLRCGGGTVQTNGFIINSQGEVVFSENSIACNVQQGSCLPDPLALSITAPAPGTSINVATQAQIVGFGAQITNYSADFDTCRVQVLPPGGVAWTPITLTPNASGTASTNIQFNKGIAAGIYNMQLSCQRVANGQQIIVNPISRSLTVQSIGPIDQCDSNPIAAVFNPRIQKNFTDTYTGPPPPQTDPGEGGFGVQPNVTTNWRYWEHTNNYSNGTLTAATLRMWKFRPTAATRALLLKGNNGASQIAISISECPGQFEDLPSKCTGPTGSVQWSTNAGDSANTYCKLDPTKDYYVSTAQFDLNHLLSEGEYRSTYQVCAGSNCTVDYVYQVQNKLVP